jgi:hypothetical protein
MIKSRQPLMDASGIPSRMLITTKVQASPQLMPACSRTHAPRTILSPHAPDSNSCEARSLRAATSALDSRDAQGYCLPAAAAVPLLLAPPKFAGGAAAGSAPVTAASTASADSLRSSTSWYLTCGTGEERNSSS